MVKPQSFIGQMNSPGKSFCKTGILQYKWSSHIAHTFVCTVLQNNTYESSKILLLQKNYGGNIPGVLGLYTNFVTVGKSPDPSGLSFPASVEWVSGVWTGRMTPKPYLAPTFSIEIYFKGLMVTVASSWKVKMMLIMAMHVLWMFYVLAGRNGVRT